MITIGDVLRPEQIDLDLPEVNEEEAIFRVASMLKETRHVTDWNAFYSGLTSRAACVSAGKEFEICIPHARTSAVDTMVMSAGRSDGGIVFPRVKAKIHYIFVIGVPSALAADYLRIIGALARIFRNPVSEKALRNAPDAGSFLQILTQGEVAL